jgi:hypothetical protein
VGDRAQRREPVELARPRIEADAQALPPAADTSPHYVLSSTVPANWIPLLPVRLANQDGKIVSRLKRSVVLQQDGSKKLHPARGEVLNAGAELLLYDEEVPREGAYVTRGRRRLRFDQMEGDEGGRPLTPLCTASVTISERKFRGFRETENKYVAWRSRADRSDAFAAHEDEQEGGQRRTPCRSDQHRLERLIDRKVPRHTDGPIELSLHSLCIDGRWCRRQGFRYHVLVVHQSTAFVGDGRGRVEFVRIHHIPSTQRCRVTTCIVRNTQPCGESWSPGHGLVSARKDA